MDTYTLGSMCRRHRTRVLFFSLLLSLLLLPPMQANAASPIGTWSPTGSMTIARFEHTATLLPSGKVLVAGGQNFTHGVLASAELYDPASGTWSPTGSMTTARYLHTATLLPSGKVLVAGGQNSTRVVVPSAELYDPASGTWSSTGSMTTARFVHTATLLPSGKVLVAGGADTNGTVLASAELYDPASGTWSPTGSMTTTRYFHTATLLPSGKVLVAGGQNANSSLASAELYDPVSGTWSSTGSMTTTRFAHTATLLPSGKVLVAGGADAYSWLASAELYDPASGTWSSTGSMTTARDVHTATLLPSGKVLVAGGADTNGTLASAELFSSAFQVAARAYGALVSSLLIQAGPFGEVSIAGQGGNQTTTVTSISVPLVLTIAAITDSASGNATVSPAVAESSSTLSTINVLGLRVNALTATAHADSTGLATGSTTLSSVTFNGQPVKVSANPAPNTTITLAGLGTVTFNKQIVVQQSGQTSIVVNAIDLTVTVGSLTGLQVVLGHAEASVTQL